MSEIVAPDILTYPISIKRDNVQITYSPRFVLSGCLVAKMPITGAINIIYHPAELLLDYNSFDGWLRDKISPMSISLEALGVYIYDTLEILLKPKYLYIGVEVETDSRAPIIFEIQTRGG